MYFEAPASEGGRVYMVFSGLGCASKIVLPTKPFSCSSGWSVYRNTRSLQTMMASPRRVSVAMERSRYSGCKRPPQFQLLRAKKGITGVGLQRALAQLKQIHTGVSGSATPAQGGS